MKLRRLDFTDYFLLYASGKADFLLRQAAKPISCLGKQQSRFLAFYASGKADFLLYASGKADFPAIQSKTPLNFGLEETVL